MYVVAALVPSSPETRSLGRRAGAVAASRRHGTPSLEIPRDSPSCRRPERAHRGNRGEQRPAAAPGLAQARLRGGSGARGFPARGGRDPLRTELKPRMARLRMARPRSAARWVSGSTSWAGGRGGRDGERSLPRAPGRGSPAAAAEPESGGGGRGAGGGSPWPGGAWFLLAAEAGPGAARVGAELAAGLGAVGGELRQSLFCTRGGR